MDGDETKREDHRSTSTVRPQSHVLPERVGPYRILERLGEGGMGVVYLAEQTEPVRRKVALKIIKRGMDTEQVVTRFEAERQALAMMDHPFVAKVFEAGSTEDNRPYFAMEYVQGVPITEHCDRHRLTTRERLELFRKVCEGVQHAHQNAIIHRDIKPSNVLVSYRDGNAVPKIIDFGVAKAINHRLTEKTLFTEMGVLIGTPEYMSPEQAEMTGQNVDTRTDVYSLGVVLYELLVGVLPLETEELRRGGFDEIRRRIREDDPSKPSVRLSALGGAGSIDLAKQRGTDPPILRRQISGDLDWIAMKALARDRSRRYGSPAELAADVERHLTTQPVLAGPPSAVYRTRKYLRRHRTGVAMAAAAVVVLIAFAITMTIQAGRTARERDRATREASVAQQTSDFLENLFAVSDPDQARGATVTARELLDKGSDQIRMNPFDDVEVQARLMETMGKVYLKLGLYDQAESLLKESMDLRRSHLGDDHLDTLRSVNNLAVIYRNLGRYADAEPLYLETVGAQTRLLGEGHPDTLRSKNNLGRLYTDQGRYAEAESLLLDTLETRKHVLGNDHSETLSSRDNLANLYSVQGHFDKAELLHAENMEIRKNLLGDDHPDTLNSIQNLASVYSRQRRLDEAEPLFVEALETQEHVLGTDHPRTLIFKNSLANLYRRQLRYPEAVRLFRETFEALRRTLGDDHPDTLFAMNNLGSMYLLEGRFADAEPLYVETTKARKRVLGDDHPDTLHSMKNLADLYQKQGRYAEAELLFLELLQSQKRLHGDDNMYTVITMNYLAGLYLEQRRYADSEPLYFEVLEAEKRILGGEHPSTLAAMNNLADLYQKQGRYVEAESLFLETVKAKKSALGDDHRSTLYSMNNLGGLYTRQHKYEQAAALLQETLDTRLRVLGDDHPHIGFSYYNLGCLSASLGQRAEALDYLRKAVSAGWKEHRALMDMEWDSLRGDPEFKAILEEVKRDREA